MHTRRATPDDGPAISALITNCGGTPKYRKRFGTFNVANLLESGYLALVVGDRDLASSEGHQMLGFLVFSDGPRGAPHAAEPWLAALSAARFAPGKGPTIGDAVWLEFCVAESGSAGRAVVEAATTAALHALPAVDHVVLALGGKEDVPAECAGLFGRLEPVPRGDGEPDPALESLYKSTLAYCGREALVPTLLIRAACVEDSDDLLPIFEQQSEVLSANFGDFFLAEMIEAQDDMNRAVVATVDGRAVGLLAASTDIDVAMLQKCFQLEPYGNLVANAGPEAPAAEAPPPDADGGVADAAAAPAAAPAPAAPAESALAEAPAEETAAAAPGASNVLAITLFCLDEAHECRARDFFPSVFALFPGRDYCVVTAPPTMKASAPFLKDFVAVPSRLGSTFSHTLFLLHRASLVAAEQLRVRRFDPAVHAAPAAALLASRGDDAPTADGDPAPTPDQIVAGLGADFSVPLEEGPNAAAFVAVVAGAVVAVVSVSRKAASTNVLNWLKANYHIEDFVPFERHRARAQASLGLLVVNPIFAAHARFVLKEVMRLYDKTVLYHESALGDRMPPLVLKELVPVRARWRPTPEPGGALLLEHRPKGDDEPPPAAAAAGDDDTATVGSASAARDGPPPRARGELLHYFTRRLASDRKAEVHARVVVVGLSCCAVGLLQELLFEPGLHLSHVTLVSPNGVPDPEHSGASRYEAFDEDFPARFQFEALGLGQRLRVVHARVVDLDRANKAVVLPDGAIVLYDVLVLTNGLQESSAKRLARSAGPDFAGGLALLGDDGVHGDEFGDGEVMRVDLGEAGPGPAAAPRADAPTSTAGALGGVEGGRGGGRPPPSLEGFVSLSQDDMLGALKVELARGRHLRGVAVFGVGVGALAAVRGLLDAGVDGEQIQLVVPADALESLGDAVVDRVAAAQLTEVGVRVLYDLELRRLVHHAETGELEKAVFAPPPPRPVAGSPPAPPWHDAQGRAQQGMTVDVERCVEINR